MKNRLLLLLRYIHRFSLLKGLGLFASLHLFKKNQVELKSFPTIHLRKNTSDVDIFNQVFLDLEYDIDYNSAPKFIIDAGANIGLTSLFFSNKFPDAKIIAIEPDEDNFKLLQSNCSSRNNIRPIQKALWKDQQPVYFQKGGTNDAHHITDNSTATVRVETVTIPELIDVYNIPEIDILKIDIEGAEKELFSKDADVWLSKVKLLVIELHDRLLPGCSVSVLKALSNYNFNMKMKGELLIFEMIGGGN